MKTMLLVVSKLRELATDLTPIKTSHQFQFNKIETVSTYNAHINELHIRRTNAEMDDRLFECKLCIPLINCGPTPYRPGYHGVMHAAHTWCHRNAESFAAVAMEAPRINPRTTCSVTLSNDNRVTYVLQLAAARIAEDLHHACLIRAFHTVRLQL